MSDQIYIQKKPKKVDAVRIHTAEDIPEQLRDSISIDDEGKLHMQNAETGESVSPAGAIVRFDPSEDKNCPAGFNCWPISAKGEARFVERPDGWYQKPVPSPAAPIDEGSQFPGFMNGAAVEQKRDGTYTVATSWGESSGAPGEAYFVRYGTNKDGTPDVNILTKTEKAFDDYEVCTPDGKTNICTLRQFDDTLTAMREQDPNVSFDAVAREAKRRAEQPATGGRGSEFDSILETPESDGVDL